MSRMGHNREMALYDHILSLERIQDEIDEARGDYNARKAIAKEDGFDTNVIQHILKCRKNGDGQTRAFRAAVDEYEAMIERAELANEVPAEDEDEEPGEGNAPGTKATH